MVSVSALTFIYASDVAMNGLLKRIGKSSTTHSLSLITVKSASKTRLLTLTSISSSITVGYLIDLSASWVDIIASFNSPRLKVANIEYDFRLI